MIFTELLGIGDDDAFDLGGLPGAIVGAVVLLWGYERFVASRAPAPARTQAPGQLEGGRGGERRASERRRAEGGGERRRQRRDRPEGDP